MILAYCDTVIFLLPMGAPRPRVSEPTHTLEGGVLAICNAFTRSDFKDPILVPKIGSRRSYSPISRFCFCGENVGRSFVVCLHYPIFRTDKESSILRQNDHRDIMQNLSAPFIYQEKCQMKIEHVLLPSVFFFQNYRPMCRKVISLCSHDPIFGTNKNRILKNGSCERAFTLLVLTVSTLQALVIKDCRILDINGV